MSMSDPYDGWRMQVKNVGLDIGTRTIVVGMRNGEKAVYIHEVNGYWVFQRSTKFIENMLDDPKKVRADGTVRPARWFKLGDSAVVIGRDAEEFAYAHNSTMLRPMAHGSIAPDECAMTVLSALVHGMLTMAEREVSKFDKAGVSLCYCTTAPAVNGDVNVDYHRMVVDSIIKGYAEKSEVKIDDSVIKESHAIVLAMSPTATGVGISWGAGTVTVSFVRQGIELFSFSHVGSGDWIDEETAKRHGYDPNGRKPSKETPTTVARRKHTIDLTPGATITDRVGFDVVSHYDILMSKVVDGMANGFADGGLKARMDGPMDVFMAGGTSSPKGFAERFEPKLRASDVPFEIGAVSKSPDPLFCVATGCLMAAENA